MTGQTAERTASRPHDGAGWAVRIDRSISIERDPGTCFGALADLERIPEWQRGTRIDRVFVQGDDPVGARTRFRLERRYLGRRNVWLDCQVTTFVPPDRSDSPGRLGYGSTGWRGFALSVLATVRAAHAGTSIDWSLRLATPRLLRPLAPLIAGEISRAVDRDLAGLKSWLESTCSLGD